MAGSKSYRFLPRESDAPSQAALASWEPSLELDEADVVWSASPALQCSSSSRDGNKRPSSRKQNIAAPTATVASLPVSVPDWSKILMMKEDYGAYDDEVEGGNRIPPHEFLAKQLAGRRIASSFSVHEGVGRTLKGRDLSRVRNAIWAKTGFQD